MSYYVIYSDDEGTYVAEFTDRSDARIAAGKLAATYRTVKLVEGKTLVAWHEPDTRMKY